jgi:hypothetical protein
MQLRDTISRDAPGMGQEGLPRFSGSSGEGADIARQAYVNTLQLEQAVETLQARMSNQQEALSDDLPAESARLPPNSFRESPMVALQAHPAMLSTASTYGQADHTKKSESDMLRTELENVVRQRDQALHQVEESVAAFSALKNKLLGEDFNDDAGETDGRLGKGRDKNVSSYAEKNGALKAFISSLWPLLSVLVVAILQADCESS